MLYETGDHHSCLLSTLNRYPKVKFWVRLVLCQNCPQAGRPTWVQPMRLKYPGYWKMISVTGCHIALVASSCLVPYYPGQCLQQSVTDRAHSVVGLCRWSRRSGTPYLYMALRDLANGWLQPELCAFTHRCNKRFLRFFIQVTFFTFFNVFLIFSTFFIFKKRCQMQSINM